MIWIGIYFKDVVLMCRYVITVKNGNAGYRNQIMHPQVQWILSVIWLLIKMSSLDCVSDDIDTDGSDSLMYWNIELFSQINK